MAKKTYKVTGELPVAGHAPGSVFTHDFGDQEANHLASGAIKESTAKPKEAEAEDTAAVIDEGKE